MIKWLDGFGNVHESSCLAEFYNAATGVEWVAVLDYRTSEPRWILKSDVVESES